MVNELSLLWILLFSVVPPASAQVSVAVGFPGERIGIHLFQYPRLEPVPGSPVYYAPRLNSNYFFYDGMYWVFEADSWYASSWYNGPWSRVSPDSLPLYVLRVPVRYYRQPPVYFQGWQRNSAPRWESRWGDDWARRRSGWERVSPESHPAAAPLPAYQRQYGGDKYPRPEQQPDLQRQHYRYQPREPMPPRAQRQGGHEEDVAGHGRGPAEDHGREQRR